MKLEKLDCSAALLICRRNELCPTNSPIKASGVEGLLEYEALPDSKHHPDCLYEGYRKDEGYYGESQTRGYFDLIYGKNAKIERSDTVFNAWASYLKRLICGIDENCLKEPYDVSEVMTVLSVWSSKNEENKVIISLINTLSDYHHSLANFMPAPVGFNGTCWYDGKGRFDQDNDLPDLYYHRSATDFPKKRMWLDTHSEAYGLSFFRSFKSGYDLATASRPIDVGSAQDLETLKTSVRNAILCIEKRAKFLYKKMLEENV